MECPWSSRGAPLVILVDCRGARVSSRDSRGMPVDPGVTGTVRATSAPRPHQHKQKWLVCPRHVRATSAPPACAPCTWVPGPGANGGTCTSCADFVVAGDCTNATGCSWNANGNRCESCDRLTNVADCWEAEGCQWSPEPSPGTCTACSENAQRDPCMASAGCTAVRNSTMMITLKRC